MDDKTKIELLNNRCKHQMKTAHLERLIKRFEGFEKLIDVNIGRYNDEGILTERTVSALSRRSLRIATGEIGEEEKPLGSNSGTMVDKYLASVGLKPGYPWCAAFVCWCIQAAAKDLSVEHDVPVTAWTPDFEKAPGFTKDVSTMYPGDLFLLHFNGRIRHVGFVKNLIPKNPGWYETIEGNTNASGGVEGVEVGNRKRRMANTYGIVTF